jgi:hypothetical protein
VYQFIVSSQESYHHTHLSQIRKLRQRWHVCKALITVHSTLTFLKDTTHQLYSFIYLNSARTFPYNSYQQKLRLSKTKVHISLPSTTLPLPMELGSPSSFPCVNSCPGCSLDPWRSVLLPPLCPDQLQSRDFFLLELCLCLRPLSSVRSQDSAAKQTVKRVFVE